MADVSSSICDGREALFSAYLDGELLPGELERVVTHLDSCERCVAAFHAVKVARTAVRLLPVLEPPPELLADHFGEDLSAYLDGELGSGEVVALTEHLSGCAECRRRLHELDAARTAVRALPTLEMPDDAAASAGVRRRSHLRRRLAAVAAAAVLALTLGLAMTRSETVPALDLEELATRHQARFSVEAGFSVIPASVSGGSER